MRYTYRERIVDEVAENEHNQDSPCDGRSFSLQESKMELEYENAVLAVPC